MKKLSFIIVLLLIYSCNKSKSKDIATNIEKIEFSKKVVNQLIQLPLKCVETEYPNKLSQTIGDSSYLKTPKELHPTFYGCFDWHSSVHGYWSLIKLLKDNPDLENYNSIIKLLKENISKENILVEVSYFDDQYNKNFERTYGWAWLLKLAEELHTWNTKDAKILESNLKPLTSLIIEKYITFLPKLNYPIRVGTHTNTAFGLIFAYDYAKTTNNNKLQKAIVKKSELFFKNDSNCPMSWEPGGYDFLSPCLQEAALMKRILNPLKFNKWLNDFLPELQKKNYTLNVGEVSDRTDGHLVHLDGVNFSRAWCLNEIAKNNPDLDHLRIIARNHIKYSLPNLINDDYEGGHWLASFAIYALNSQY